MTPVAQALDAAIENGDLDGVVTLLAPLDERARRGLAPAAAAAYAREASAGNHSANDRAAIEAMRRRQLATVLAQYGTGTFANVRACRGWWDARISQILIARRPPWLEEWANLDGVPANMQEFVLEAQWRTVRELRRASVVAHRKSEGATLGLMLQARAFASGALALLDADAELLEDDVWELFVHEGTAQISLAAVDKYTRPDHQWSHAFIALAERGTIDRARLLDATLDVLERDFIQFRAGWFSRLHESLRPSIDERAARAARYSRLLASRIPPTVSFAMSALRVLAKANAPLPAETLSALPHAYRAKAKGTALDALGLAERLLQGHAEAATQVGALTAALEHPSLEVQTRALDLIERFAGASEAALRDRLAPMCDAVAPTLRARVGALALMPAKARAAEPAPRVPFERAPIHPIEDVETLVDAAAAALEDERSPDELERLLDGVSRLCALRPHQFDRLTGPLRKRAAFVRERPSGIPPVRRLVAALIHAWLAGAHVPSAMKPYTSVEAFLVARIDELSARAATACAAPLLAAPTTTGCTIDPRTFIARCVSARAPLARYDTIAALLRTEHAHRDEALAAAHAIAGEIGMAIRYALGDDTVTIGGDAALWIAASRCRDANRDDARVEAAHPEYAAAGGTRAAAISLTWTIDEYTYRPAPGAAEVTMRSPKPALALRPHAMVRPPFDVPTINAFCNARETNPLAEPRPIDLVRWLGSIWPTARDAWFARGCCELATNLDWHTAKWSDRAYLEPLLDGDAAIGDAARILLTLGLLAKDPAQGVLAVDAVSLALADGRLSSRAFETMVGDIVAWAPYTKTQRAIPRLAEIAHASTGHAAYVAGAIASAVTPSAFLKPAIARAFHALRDQLDVLTAEKSV